ncbi:Phosphatidylinositol alpha-mannosyltransferase [Thermobaculum terrenum ATCC BAA-798]|uniref:Phosphatidylinositol alpha-mannosyltransferase n=1 Tax=Thermobaculum terrenum (strain ATCC BAA-798 / CCMEE 7001 / YNP1) TaxID=525904 RepID=D1CDA7_THET1|nr:Phosphatidylinositol alpha-mannosyltransferase [Thermobaculum terrenum ATCC BAA-798]
MKIALVSPYDFATYGGVNQHILHLKREFQKHGHRVSIIAPVSDSGVELNIPDFYGFGGVVPISLNGSVARLSFSLDLRWKIKLLMERERFDIVHLQEPLIPALPLMVLQYSRSINIGTFHAYAESSLGYFYARPVLQRFFNKLDGLIAVSEPAKEFASQYFDGEFHIIPNGVDVQAFSRHVAPVKELMDGRPNILFLGRFEEERKGFKYALKSLRWVKHFFPDIRLVVAGKGDPDKFWSRIQKYHIEDNVRFVGVISDEERPAYMRSCKLLIAPSTHGESQGIVLLEAMAAGLPVVAGNIPGYASVVTNGQEGFLVPPEDEHTLALAIVRLLSDEALRNQMGNAGRRKANDYSWPKIANQLLEFYSRVRREKMEEEAKISGRSKFVSMVLRKVKGA